MNEVNDTEQATITVKHRVAWCRIEEQFDLSCKELKEHILYLEEQLKTMIAIDQAMQPAPIDCSKDEIPF